MTEVKKDCNNCRYSGMDMDMEPYCVHPEVRKRMPYGQILSSLAAPTQPGRECEGLKLWEPRER